MGGRSANREKIAAEAALASGGPSRGRATPARAKAEHAAGADRVPRLIEAGGGKRPVEAGGKPEGKRLIEAGGGKKRLDPEIAELDYLEERALATEGVPKPEVVTEEVTDLITPELITPMEDEAVSAESDGTEEE